MSKQEAEVKLESDKDYFANDNSNYKENADYSGRNIQLGPEGPSAAP